VFDKVLLLTDDLWDELASFYSDFCWFVWSVVGGLAELVGLACWMSSHGSRPEKGHFAGETEIVGAREHCRDVEQRMEQRKKLCSNVDVPTVLILQTFTIMYTTKISVFQEKVPLSSSGKRKEMYLLERASVS
jgi:hypothetical protein